jgi:Domain of unknown function (DUF2382)/PRC-barrel domain
MVDIDTALGWRGRTVRDRDGEKLGTLGAIYLDEATDRPAFAGVRTGLFKQHESIVPLAGMEEEDEGDLRIPHTADRVREAPNVDPDVALGEDEQDRLSEHYDAPLRTEGDEREMVRSEEEVEVGVRPSVHKERVRLRKYMVTENVETTVPVRREEIRVEQDPPPEGNVVDVQDVDEDDPEAARG